MHRLIQFNRLLGGLIRFEEPQFVRIKVEGGLQHHYIRDKRWGDPAGRIEPNETPEQAAHRELIERTGHAAGKLEYQGRDADGFHVFHASKVRKIGPPQTETRYFQPSYPTGVVKGIAAANPDLAKLLKEHKAGNLRLALHESLSRRYRQIAIPKPRLGLSSVLDDLIEFGDLSISTAKKVIRALSQQGTNPKLQRPQQAASSYYVPPGRSNYEYQMMGALMQPSNKAIMVNSVVVPRKITGPESVGPPLVHRIHETAHSADPSLGKMMDWSLNMTGRAREAMVSRNMEDLHRKGLALGRVNIGRETRANKIALEEIKKHGTPQEVERWKKISSQQIRKGYQLPILEATKSAFPTGKVPLSQAKMLMRHAPSLKRIRFSVLSLGSFSLNELLDNLIQFQEPRRHYGEVAKDAAIGGVTSAVGTAGLLAATGLGLRRKAPALSKMLTTAAGQHIKVFNPMHTAPMMRSLPEASRLFGKQLAGVKEVEHMATSGAIPSMEHVAASFQKTGITPEKDIADIAAFKKKWGRTPGESMEKSVGLLSGLAATGVGAAGGAALSKGWDKKREFSAELDSLIEFARGQYAKPVLEGIRKAEGMSWAARKLTASAINPFYEQKAPKEGGALWQAIRDRAAKKIRAMRNARIGLNAKLDDLIEFGLLSDTKKLIKHLRGQGVEITKGIYRDRGGMGGASFTPQRLINHPGWSDYHVGFPKTRFINIERGYKPQGGAGQLPLLWHEAGHALGRTSEVPKESAKRILASERGANRKALALADMLQVSPEGRAQIKRGLNRSFQGYKQSEFNSIVSSKAFAKLREANPDPLTMGKEERDKIIRKNYSLSEQKKTLAEHPWLRGLKFSAVLDDLIEFGRGEMFARHYPKLAPLPGDKLNEAILTKNAELFKSIRPKGNLAKERSKIADYLKYRRKTVGHQDPTWNPMNFSSARNLFNKVKEIQFKTLYIPGEKDEPPEELPDFSEGQPVDYTVQQHHAKRAGFHRDIRIGTPKHGLYSWATRKELPEEGGKIAIHPQPVHSHDYLGWEGDIPPGYGAGKVSTEHLGKALITKSTPTEVHATLADQKEHHRLAFVKTPKGWLLARGKHPEPPTEAQKPKYKSVSQEDAPEHLSSIEPGTIVQPKVDGALVYVTTKGNRPEIFSHRKSKVSNKNILHTERVFHGRPATNIPKEHQRTLLGELYGTRGGKAIEPQELGGILNTHLGESIAKQKARGVKLKIMPFDYANGKGESYPERLEKVKSTLQYMPKDVFQTPPEATTPSAARDLYEKVRSGRHPLTKEGVIIHPPEGKMVKIKNVEEENVKIHSVFPGKGKFENGYGGFYYADKSGRPLGRVGTGFTEETRAELPKYIGRTARVRHQGKYKSGRLRAPSLIAIEENK